MTFLSGPRSPPKAGYVSHMYFTDCFQKYLERVGILDNLKYSYLELF